MFKIQNKERKQIILLIYFYIRYQISERNLLNPKFKRLVSKLKSDYIGL